MVFTRLANKKNNFYVVQPFWAFPEMQNGRTATIRKVSNFNGQDRSQDLGGSSPVQEDGNRGKRLVRSPWSAP
jgi:hypothetical protein